VIYNELGDKKKICSWQHFEQWGMKVSWGIKPLLLSIFAKTDSKE
jgi:hypothetical protein